ncbi:protease family s26 mitochondrial inner membrane protease-related [Holotrichia oblita]|uniref:Protease family s26 mitochondrial inner membrane protease-related n=2 Tax=Holotrichia oblita TaxID=644536 RepID=A0ACB9T9L4_HOLOL|nr:protease family s26 mitochondrial inner membrane protease-related [Holotrichia oblita]KAI4463501.1 protease family s26 mitochondrial inner membrane protease-related [Holotrichia oblita]
MQRLVSKFVDTAIIFVQYGCIAHCTLEYVADLVVCSGPSMEPTLYSNNVLLAEHISPQFDKLSRGDIIIAKCPTNANQYICKRVVGLPGDKIRTGFMSHIVPRGHVWLEGDNRGNSSDSRTYGPVPKGLIRSRAIFKIWPLADATYLKD